MKKTKIEKKFIYEGLGFPVVLHNAPMAWVRGAWVLDVDLNVLQRTVLLELAHHESDLTGDQIFFIRTFLGYSQMQFGEWLGVTHPAVVKWEKRKEQPAKINLNSQRDLRLLLLDQLLSRDGDFRKAFRLIHSRQFSNRVVPLEFEIPNDLAVI